MSRWSTSPRTCSSSHSISVVVEDRALVVLQHAGGAGVDHDQPGVGDVAGEAPPVGRRLLVGAVGEGVELARQVELVLALVAA